MKYAVLGACVLLVACSSPTAPRSTPSSQLLTLADWSSLVGSTWTGTATATRITGATETWTSTLTVAWGQRGPNGVESWALASGFTNDAHTALLSAEQDRVATMATCEGHWTHLRASDRQLTVEVTDAGGCLYRAIRWEMRR